ncbi:hypothetical protein I5P77_00015 [Serratia ureilytica]|uniref:hypothetical protein n=1 Tax=Serratia ureilytica TaxID=300181 RepID=UPI0018D8592F|nr:hypothetical protein [Serratia ureilytica]MBH2651818.1 hypothetical protein [Serratia ureilytica]
MPIIEFDDNMASRIAEDARVLAEQVKVVDDYIVINVSYEYNIPLISCQTAEGVLDWVWHLTEKTWMTNEVMRRFIEIACGATGVKFR